MHHAVSDLAFKQYNPKIVKTESNFLSAFPKCVIKQRQQCLIKYNMSPYVNSLFIINKARKDKR